MLIKCKRNIKANIRHSSATTTMKVIQRCHWLIQKLSPWKFHRNRTLLFSSTEVNRVLPSVAASGQAPLCSITPAAEEFTACWPAACKEWEPGRKVSGVDRRIEGNLSTQRAFRVTCPQDIRAIRSSLKAPDTHSLLHRKLYCLLDCRKKSQFLWVPSKHFLLCSHCTTSQGLRETPHNSPEHFQTS